MITAIFFGLILHHFHFHASVLYACAQFLSRLHALSQELPCPPMQVLAYRDGSRACERQQSAKTTDDRYLVTMTADPHGPISQVKHRGLHGHDVMALFPRAPEIQDCGDRGTGRDDWVTGL
jgi:hypothetical protein